jgi:hypothetical protein
VLRVHSNVVDEIRFHLGPRDEIALDRSRYLNHHDMTGCDFGSEVS